MKLLEGLQRKRHEQQAIEAYNLGLAAKYKGNWEESLRQNQRADELRPGDGATLWNLAIAATALRDWDAARSAWSRYGVPMNDGPGEVRGPKGIACVRLNPQNSGEVVWGTRLDPARIQIDNVPLPESGRRYADIVLNDGAPEGTRLRGGQEYPVFDELGLWEMSAHSTYGVELVMPGEEALQSLVERCRVNDIGIEDWRTVRALCAQCSRGTPGEHDCTHAANGQIRFGFGAISEITLRQTLSEWAKMEEGAELGPIDLLLSGVS